jgi:hypothetical protein
VHFGEIIEPALFHDFSLLKYVDQRIQNDPYRKVGIRSNCLIGFVTSWKGTEGQIGERRHSNTMRELAGIPRGLQ